MRDIRDDLHMDRPVIAHAEAVDGVDVGAAPEHIQLIVLVDPIDDA